MYKILFPIADSEFSQKTVKQGVEFAKALNAKLIALHVTPKVHLPSSEGFAMPAVPALEHRIEEESITKARKVLASVEAEAKRAGVECECVVGANDVIYDEIIKSAENKKSDLIMMSSHGHRGGTRQAARKRNRRRAVAREIAGADIALNVALPTSCSSHHPHPLSR